MKINTKSKDRSQDKNEGEQRAKEVGVKEQLIISGKTSDWTKNRFQMKQSLLKE